MRSASCFYERVCRDEVERQSESERESRMLPAYMRRWCVLSIGSQTLSEPRVNTHNASWMDERERVPLSSKQALKAKTKRPRACRDDH